jgi:hypothetical protein
LAAQREPVLAPLWAVSHRITVTIHTIGGTEASLAVFQ